ncbi:ABC transporter ATP-binding protein [Nocardia mangyaensis]|uniref:ABC transporter ATP-binding protein n=1 Tax=Nocardia mangyaensis TaxID=2213200 RepID=UPI0026750171|nr:ABC transporter ATP-binding protein [Nocardia mangyaensis]MDO3647860.1 ABC transporter ATP-binding protein [Nocardia mangyaensis]
MGAHNDKAADLSTSNLSVVIDGRRIVADLDLDVPAGEILGLIGPNGSGKSTVLRCVYRALEPSAGVVRVAGDDLSDLSLRASAQRVAALTQQAGTDFDFTVAELVALGRAPHKRGNEPLTARERQLCRDAMARLDIDHLADRGVLGLSGGERQRVLIARALVQEPRVLILDEPTNHLDIRHQIELLGFLRTLGLTVLIVLHDLNLAAAVCDRIAVLADGRLHSVGSPADVLTADLIATVFGIEVSVIDHPLTGAPQILHLLATQPSASAHSATHAGPKGTPE